MSADLSALGPIVAELSPIVEAFRAAGFELRIVGGLVRDLAAGDAISFADVDLATDALPDQIRALVSDHVESMWRQGERFGTIGMVMGDHKIEVTTYRAEVYRPESRKPSVRFSEDLDTDLSRRDFTINAMAVTLPSPTLLDPFGGLNDLRQHILRTPLDPAVSFDDDPLRMLRGARFVARMDLEVASGVIEAMEQRADRIAIVSHERVGDEFLKLLALDRPSRGLALLDDTGLLVEVLPEISVLSRSDRRVVMTMVDSVQPPDPLWRLAGICALLAPGADSTMGERLRMPREHRRVMAAAGEAIRLAGRLTGPDPVVARQVAALVGPDLDPPVAALRARAAALESHERPTDATPIRRAAAALVRSRDELSGEDLSNLDPGMTGDQVMKELGLEPGPAVGRALRWLEQIRYSEGSRPADELRSRLRVWWGQQDSGQ